MGKVVIYNSKRYFFIYMLMDVALFACGVYFLFTDIYILGLLAIIGSFFSVKGHIRSFKDRIPKVVICSSGIRTSLTGYKEWSEMIKCEIIPKSSPWTEGGLEFYLRIEYLRGSKFEKSDILVDNLNITRRKLKRLIKQYSNGKF